MLFICILLGKLTTSKSMRTSFISLYLFPAVYQIDINWKLREYTLENKNQKNKLDKKNRKKIYGFMYYKIKETYGILPWSHVCVTKKHTNIYDNFYFLYEYSLIFFIQDTYPFKKNSYLVRYIYLTFFRKEILGVGVAGGWERKCFPFILF